jgi:hypothetical protein
MNMTTMIMTDDDVEDHDNDDDDEWDRISRSSNEWAKILGK